MMMGYDNMVSEPPAPLSACAQEAMATTEMHDVRVQQMLQQLLAKMEAASPSTPVPTADATMDTTDANLVSARRVFEEMSGHQEANIERGLRVTVSQVFYPVTEEVPHQVFDAYGAKKVCDLEVADCTEALVLFWSSHDVVRARDACHGRCIYDNCCWLDLQYVQPLPTNSTPVMPGKCSTPCLSHDAKKPKVASTPVAASTMPLTTSVATDTTSFAQIKAKQPGACKVFVGMPRKTESEAKYHRFVKWVSRVCITRRLVHWAMRSKLGSSSCEVKVSDVKEDNAAQGNVLDTELKHTVKLDIKQPTKVFDEMASKAGVMEGKTGELSLWEEGYYTSTRQWQTLVVSGDHVVFVKLPKDGKPQELPSQENFMVWLQPDQAIGVKSLVVEMAEIVYEEMLTTSCILNKVNTANFARCLCGVGKFNKAFQIIKEMMRKGFVPDTSTYSKVITFLCQAKKVEKAFLLFQEMKRAGVNPDVYTYTILIDSFCKAGLIEQAQSWFDEMRSVSCSPNVVTYTALLHAYLKAKQLLLANDIFHRMVDAGCRPNGITYSALIDGLCKSDTIAPNVVTYGALIDGFCKVGKIDNAQEVFLQMTKCGYLPSVHTYTSLIDRMFKDGFHSDSLEDWDLHLSAQTRSQLLIELDNYLENGLVPTEKHITSQELYKEGLNASLQGVLTGGTIDYLFDYHEWGPFKFTDAPRQFHGDINIFTENIMSGTDGRMPMSILTINSVAHLWLKRMQWSVLADCLCFKARKLKRTDIIVRQWDPGIKQIGFRIFLLKWCAIEMLWMLLPWPHSYQSVYIPDYMLKPGPSRPLLGFHVIIHARATECFAIKVIVALAKWSTNLQCYKNVCFRTERMLLQLSRENTCAKFGINITEIILYMRLLDGFAFGLRWRHELYSKFNEIQWCYKWPDATLKGCRLQLIIVEECHKQAKQQRYQYELFSFHIHIVVDLYWIQPHLHALQIHMVVPEIVLLPEKCIKELVQNRGLIEMGNIEVP